MTYALDQPRPVCAAIRDKFSLPQNNLVAMRVAGYYFMMSWRGVGRCLQECFVLTLTLPGKGLDYDKESLKAKREKQKSRYATGAGRPKELISPVGRPAGVSLSADIVPEGWAGNSYGRFDWGKTCRVNGI